MKQIFFLGLLFVIGLSLSYALAQVGEPQSAWIWCDVLRLCTE